MNYKFFHFALLFVIICSCNSKKSNSKIQPKEIKAIDFNFGEYKLNSEIEHWMKVTNDGDFVASEFSFVSENRKLIEALDTNSDTILPISEEQWKTINDEFEFKNAIEHILKLAKNHDYVMINEAHSIPQHRNFVKRLLPELAKIGFNYLALEALGNNPFIDYNNEIHKKGYPNRSLGVYIKEPEFGNLIREAVLSNYTIIGYDGDTGKEREIKGAKNIIDQVGVNGKTVILCGWDHIREVETGHHWEYALAGRIKEYTGKDPLTINQTQYYERSNKVFEDSIYQLFDYEESMVLLDKKGASFDVEKNKDWYDLFIFHPRTKYTKGIPNWILDKQVLHSFQISNIGMDCPCKLFLYNKTDEFNATPIYIQEINSIQEEINIPIKKGQDYKIIISNKINSYSIDI